MDRERVERKRVEREREREREQIRLYHSVYKPVQVTVCKSSVDFLVSYLETYYVFTFEQR